MVLSVLPIGVRGIVVAGLIAALQDNFRVYQQNVNPPRGPLN